MKKTPKKCDRLSATETFPYTFRRHGPPAWRALQLGILVLLLCIPVLLSTHLVWSAERAPSFPVLSGSLAGRPTVTSTAQPGLTPGGTEKPGARQAAETPLKPGPDPSDWLVLLRDTFDDNSANWEVGAANFDVASLRRTVADGKYRWELEARQPALAWTESGIDLPAEFYAAIDVRLISGSAAGVTLGLAVRPVDLADMRLFLLSPVDGVAVRRGISDSVEAILAWTRTAAIQPDERNRLAIKATGSNLALYVNDQQVAEAVDVAFPRGRLCLVTGASNSSHYVLQFDNLEVRVPPGTVLPSPSMLPEMPPTPLSWGKVLPEAPYTTPPNWPIVFWDEFVDDGNGWVTHEQFDRQIEASKVVEGTFAWQFEAIEAAQPVVEVPHAPVTDFYAAVDAKQYSGPADVWYGLTFRWLDARHFYTFLVNDQQKYQIWARAGDALHQLVEPTGSESIRPGGPNRVGVVGEGTVFAFFVNDQSLATLKIEAENINFPAGLLGLALDVDAGDAGIIEFDNFELRVPPER